MSSTVWELQKYVLLNNDNFESCTVNKRTEVSGKLSQATEGNDHSVCAWLRKKLSKLKAKRNKLCRSKK